MSAAGGVVGTAGHVDHGKTALVRALTGVDTDRLEEEKRRGLTIQPGFAALALPGGGMAGVVDVPGHERFIKNMLACAGGVDVALLVVAADDGPMPQTHEHLAILELLGVRRGILALTKADIVDEARLAQAAEELRGAVRGGFLQDAPLVATSAATGQGIDELRALIDKQLASRVLRNTQLPARMPVDRAFAAKGFGLVATGTLLEGSLAPGDEVELLPKGCRARVRGMQAHGQPLQRAQAGGRLAVNLAGLDAQDIARGDVLAAPGSLVLTKALDAELRLLPLAPRALAAGDELMLYHGARALPCRVAWLGGRLGPGGRAVGQLRFDKPLAAKPGDAFVLRLFSPNITAGGGRVLDVEPQRHTKKDKSAAARLAALGQGDTAEQRLLYALEAAPPAPRQTEEIAARFCIPQGQASEAAAKLQRQGLALPLGGGLMLAAAHKAELARRAEEILRSYHAQQPLLAGMDCAALGARLLPGQQGAAQRLLALLVREGILHTDAGLASLPGFAPQATARQQALRRELEDIWLAAGFAPPAAEPVCRARQQPAAARQLLKALCREGVLVQAGNEGLLFHKDVVQQARQRLEERFGIEPRLTLAAYRDALGTTRRYALALLEHFDKTGLTRRENGYRLKR